MSVEAPPIRNVRAHLDRPQVSASHYKHDYNCKGRLASYWHQVNETLKFKPDSVLEIGPGTGFTTDSLRREGVDVLTVDVDLHLNPSCVASVRALPVKTKSFDVVLCCQVLEHLPFESFVPAMRELLRAARKGVVMSLPDRDRFVAFSLFNLRRSFAQRVIEWPRPVNKQTRFIDNEHYWEIGHGGVTLKTVESALKEAGCTSSRTYRVFEHPWHRFFILELSESRR